MSLRAVCIVSVPHSSAATVIYYRIFPTCEKRAKLKHGDSYTPMPSHATLASALVDALCFQQDDFKEWRDGADLATQLPAIELRTAEGPLWPFIFVKQHGHYFCSMPLVESVYEPRDRPNLITLPAVTAAFSIVNAVLGFLGRPAAGVGENWPKLGELDTFLSVAAPFGRLQTTEPSVVEAMTTSLDVFSDERVKVPAWRPVAHRGKPSISVGIKEVVHATQCDRSDMQPVATLSGEVYVHCELEGQDVEVVLWLKHAPDVPLGTPFAPDALLVHPCVALGPEAHEKRVVGKTSPKQESVVRTFRFSPPAHRTVLCYYTFSRLPRPPVEGAYSMRGDKNVEFLLQLKLHEGVRNSFELFDVKVPFYNRGHIKKSSLTPSCGTVFLSKDRFSLMWSVGTKFEGKCREASLSGTVTFQDREDSDGPQNTSELFSGLTSYAQVFFRTTDHTMGGYFVDSVRVTPACKPKTFLDHRTESFEYRIWNKFGELPFAVPRTT